MRKFLKLKNLTATLSLSIFFLFLLSLPARAGSTVDDFISDYQSIENNLPNGTSLPISSATLISVKSLFVCVDNGGDIGVCINDFSQTPTGSQMVTESGLPSSVMSVLHAYAEYKDGDIWGVVYYLGEAVTCAVVQVLAGGVDICGLVKELIEMGKAIWNAAIAAVEWFKDVGEAILNGLEDAGCALHVCCCDEPPPPPPEWQVLYSGYFAPRLSEGLNAIKDNSYNKLPNFITAIKSTVISKYSPGAINTASDYFSNQVDGAWTAEIVPPDGILNQLNNKRTEYNKPEKIVEVAAIAVTQEKPSEKIISVCSKYYSDLGYNHVDRWKDAHSNLANQFGQEKNFAWCSNRFFHENINLFSQQFRQYISSHGCPLLGNLLSCQSISSYKSCLNIMKSVNREGECIANSSVMGPEAAKKIKDEMIAKGSNQQLYPCAIINPSGSISNQPSQMIWTRPAQEYNCNLIKQKLFGELPQNLVNCYLQESASYKNLSNNVQQARLKLSFKHPGIAIKPGLYDPLIAFVHSSEEIEILKTDPINQTFDFPPPSTRRDFLYATAFGSGSMDGTDTPQIILQLDKPDFQNNPMQTPKDRVIKYSDPRDNPDLTQNLKQNLAVNPISQGMPAQSAFINAPINQKMPGAENQGQQQVMSGSLPPGSQPLGASNTPKVSFNQNRPIKSEPYPVLDRPDLAADNKVTIGGVSYQWGGIVQLSGQRLQDAGRGLCRVSVSYTIRNNGAKPAKAFNSILFTSTSNNSQPQQWNGIPANGKELRTENILIKSGQNSLKLFIDQSGKIDEQNESNNQYSLMVILNGTCQPQQQLQQHLKQSPQKGTQTAPFPVKRLLR